MSDTGNTHPERDVALAYARLDDRPLFAALFALDDALARAVRGASEPMVGQLRLAWWRDALQTDPAARPRGNPVLDDLARLFGKHLAPLAALVDGWEEVLVAERVDAPVAKRFAEGRAQAWLAAAHALGCRDGDFAIASAARVVAFADLAVGLPDAGERRTVIAVARGLPAAAALPRRLRSLAVLAALARHALARGGEPMLTGRGAALVALRAGLFGR